jgi:histidinol dehydrogenase
VRRILDGDAARRRRGGRRGTRSVHRRRAHVVRGSDRAGSRTRTATVEPSLVEALRRRRTHISAYHKMQRQYSSRSFSEHGVGMQVRSDQARVGMYVPSPGALCRRRC